MSLLRVAKASVFSAALIGATVFASPTYAQNSPGSCTQMADGGPAGSGNRSGRQNSGAVLPSVIAVAVQNVAVPVTAANLSGVNLNVVCLNDTLNQNDIRILQDILNGSPILSGNRDILNDLLQNSTILSDNKIALANGVQVLTVNTETGDLFLLRP